MASWLFLLASCMALVSLSHQICNPGQYEAATNACALCAAGHYCPLGLSMRSCAPGYYSVIIGATESITNLCPEFEPYRYQRAVFYRRKPTVP